MTERLFKVLGPNRQAYHGGRGVWNARAWMPPITDIKLCERGYHLCREGDLVNWLGPEIWEATWRGDRVDSNDKIVVSEARLVRRLTTWNDRTARLFAADCAEDSARFADDRTRLVILDTVAVVRRFANGEASAGDLDAAWDAARDAAWDAAWAAARDAAWDAAWAAAWAAARAAARGAAWAAARDAARVRQTNMLMGYLYPGGVDNG